MRDLKTHDSSGRALFGDVFMKLMLGAERRHMKPGEYFFHYGDKAKNMYVVISGEVDVVSDNMFGGGVSIRDRLFAGSFFGEIALLERHPTRARSVCAATDVEVLVIPTVAFEDALHHTNSHLHVDSSHDERILAFINMVSPTEERLLSQGEAVFSQGEIAEPAFYIVNEGSLEVFQAAIKRQPEIKVDHIPNGNCFGYVSLLDKNPYSKKHYTIKCSSGTAELLVIRGDDFHRLLDHSQVVSNLVSQLVKARSDHAHNAKSMQAIKNVRRFRGI